MKKISADLKLLYVVIVKAINRPFWESKGEKKNRWG